MEFKDLGRRVNFYFDVPEKDRLLYRRLPDGRVICPIDHRVINVPPETKVVPATSRHET